MMKDIFAAFFFHAIFNPCGIASYPPSVHGIPYCAPEFKRIADFARKLDTDIACSRFDLSPEFIIGFHIPLFRQGIEERQIDTV